jgi:hypothetical protein
LLSSYAAAQEVLIDNGVFSFSRAVTFQILNIYGIRMAGVFMISLGSI